MAKAIDFTEGKIGIPLVKFAVPLFIGAFLQQGYQMADAIIVGRFIGPDALAAVSVSATVAMLLVIFLNGLAVGISTMTAQLFGAKKHKEIKNMTFSTIYPLLAFSVVLTIIFVVFAKPFMVYVLNVPGDILEDALTYYRIYMLGFVFLCVYNVFSFNLRALGNALVPLYFLALSSVVSIVFSIVFIVVLGMGVEGAAIATVIAQFLAAIATVFYAFRKVPELNIIDKSCKFDKELFVGAMRYGVPNALQNMILAASAIFLVRLTNSFGFITIAANSAVERISGITIQFAQALSRAITTFTGQNIGAGKFDRVMKGLRSTNIVGSVIGLALTIVCLLFPYQILSLFMDSNYADAHQAILQGVSLLVWAAAGNVFVFVNYSYAAVLRGAGDMVFTSAGTVIMVVFRIVLAYFLVFLGIGYVSISISLFAMNFVAAIIMFLRLKSGKWKGKAFSGQENIDIH